jgi:hypothetical protein
MPLTNSERRVLKYPYKARDQDLIDLMDKLCSIAEFNLLGQQKFAIMFRLHRIGVSRHLNIPPAFSKIMKGHYDNNSLIHPNTEHFRCDIIEHDTLESVKPGEED